MRTLVLGLPLPHVTFDNYSFLAAPALFDYRRIIVDTAAISDVVQEVVSGSAEHKTFGGEAVVNGPSGPKAFSVAEVVRLRRREAERALENGGAIVCLAHADAAHPQIDGLPGWRRYDWLPAPEGFSYSQHLLAGYGKLGVEVTDEGHAFSRYAEEFGARLAFRAYVDEEAQGFSSYGHVFARSPGGAAVGLELRVGAGSVILLPPVGSLDFNRDRMPLSYVLYDCLERLQGGDEPSQWVRKEAS